MPTYRFVNNKTGDKFEDFMTISQMEELLASNPDLTLVPSAPMIVSGVAVGNSMKPPEAFRDRLKEIKKKHPLGNINTF